MNGLLGKYFNTFKKGSIVKKCLSTLLLGNITLQHLQKVSEALLKQVCEFYHFHNDPEYFHEFSLFFHYYEYHKTYRNETFFSQV